MNLKSLWAVGAIVALASCGGGDPITPVEEIPGGLIIVRVSAGAPLEGVNAVAYAIDPVTGEPLESRPEGAILARAERSSASGHLELKLPDDATFHGPIQVVVTGTDIHYTDPTDAAAKARVSLPNSFRLTSFVPTYTSGTIVTVPVTMWTTLADSAARAYAAGRTSESASPTPIERAFPIIDNLFSKHLSRPLSWDLRASVPVEGGGNVGSIRDVVFAALADIGLNQLARDISVTAGHEPGAVITAYQLLELLQADISDGVFNGFEGETQLAARGGIYELTSRTTRFDLARAIGAFVDSAANATGLTRQALESYSVFDNIALDRNFLYPVDEDPKAFDEFPPEIELLEPLPRYVKADQLTIRVRAADNAVAVARVRGLVQSEGDILFEAVPIEDHWELIIGLRSGTNAVQIWAEDEAVPSNSGKGWGPPYSVLGTIVRDISLPSVTPQGAPSYRDETGAPLQLSGGLPVIPGALNIVRNSKIDLNGGGFIYKTYATSSWLPKEPTPEELDGENPRNFPFQQFAVVTDDGGSPIAEVTWRIEASDGEATSISEGKPIPSTLGRDGFAHYNVVFAHETIPLLKTSKSRRIKLKVRFSATDAAGNKTTTEPYEYTYETLDTPLFFAVDETYPIRMSESSRDALSEAAKSSIYAYPINRSWYSDLFGRASAIRVGRIEVLNPWPVAFALRQANSPHFNFSEEWSHDLTPISGAATVSIDNFTFNVDEVWGSGGSPRSEVSCLLEHPSPCGYGWKTTSHVRHDKSSGVRWVCGSGVNPPPVAFSTSGERLTHASAKYVLAELGSDGEPEVLAETLGIEQAALVPAATPTTPGRIVIFPGLRPQAFHRTWHAGWDSEKHEWDRYAGLFYTHSHTAGTCTDGFGRPEQGLERYRANHWWQRLKNARSRYTGPPLEFVGRPVYSEGTAQAEAGSVSAPSTVPFFVDFVHWITDP